MHVFIYDRTKFMISFPLHRVWNEKLRLRKALEIIKKVKIVSSSYEKSCSTNKCIGMCIRCCACKPLDNWKKKQNKIKKPTFFKEKF